VSELAEISPDLERVFLDLTRRPANEPSAQTLGKVSKQTSKLASKEAA
jgi:hypothetical protein